ncbi:hypothetical protein [Vibrio europaeus]|uniref:hypothetical protein n=1 Tax=Vibrio europaeus TaxID=300876 RepID=UPI00148C239B|nr:hypothetical protein [Vibrio europaeus]MDC5838867.1 hypothetical protein [Vibrio europaeus]MDC5856634.1 hypothetical protein [Vibrio europaeus]NOH21632.1 hypothetical protein [Vibrio europaeus]
MKKLMAGLVLLFCAGTASAYEGQPKEQVDKFFKELSSAQSTQAIDKLFSNNPTISANKQQLTLLKQQFGVVLAMYGSIIGVENIHYEELSPSLVRIVEVAKHENHPVTWEFYFYKPKDIWMISQGMFVDQFQVIGTKK